MQHRKIALRRSSIGAKGVYGGPYLTGWAAMGQPQTEALPRCTACDGAGNDNGFHWMSLHYSLQLIAPSGPCCPHAFVEQAEPPLALRVQTGTVQPLQTVRTTHDATRVSANSGRSSYDQTLPRVPNCPHIPWPRADLSSHLW